MREKKRQTNKIDSSKCNCFEWFISITLRCKEENSICEFLLQMENSIVSLATAFGLICVHFHNMQCKLH